MNTKTTGNATLPKGKGNAFSIRNMRLQTRLILLLLVISVPIILSSNMLLAFRAQAFIRQHTVDQLQQINQALYSKTETWYKMNVSVLTQLAGMDGIVSMDPGEQTPVLQQTAKAFPQLFLVHTTDTAGLNVARNDGQENKDYSDRAWYQKPMAGTPLAGEVLISRTTNQPALNLSAAIKDASGKIIGVMSIVSDLTEISKDVLVFGSGTVENQTTTFIVDPTNKIIAHPDQELTQNVAELVDFSSYPPVVALRQGTTGLYEFTDDQGVEWISYLSVMNNDWGIVTQQKTDVAYLPLTMYWRISWLVIAGGSLLLLVVAYFVLRYSLRPVVELTETVAAITAGDINREARVDRGDEIGELASAFNKMNAQVRDNITNLEQRVSERTQALTLSAEISRQLNTILDLDQLTREVVNQLKQVFKYYHVHIYLFDDARENLMMVGGSGEAGQIMLARGHKITSGKGLVGRAASGNASVLVGDTSQDAGWLPNPLLPETKSELAVPISIGKNVLGVLDVQQNSIDGLTQMDKDLMEAIANQLAVAVQNARAYAQVRQQAKRDSLISLINQRIQQAASIEEVLQIAVSELGRGLGAQRSSIEVRSRNGSADQKN